MLTVPCPEMYCGEPVRYVEQHDSQGVDGWAQSYTYWELEGGECGHEYNIEQGQWMDRQLDRALESYVPDYGYLEP